MHRPLGDRAYGARHTVANCQSATWYLPCAVLEDGTRVITQRGMFVALGMNKNPSKRVESSSVDNRPAFLSANNLTPFISEELTRSWTPGSFQAS